MKKKIILAAALAVLCAGATYVQWDTDAAPTVAATSVLPRSTPVPAPSLSGRKPTGPGAGLSPQDNPADPPAWLRGTDAGNAKAAAMNPAAASAEAAKTARMDEAVKKLQKLQGSKNPEPRQLYDAIAEIEVANGSPVLSGIRLDAIRHNLLIAEKIKVVAGELQAQQTPGRGNAAAPNAAALQPKIDELQALQKQLRTDLMEPVAGAAVER